MLHFGDQMSSVQKILRIFHITRMISFNSCLNMCVRLGIFLLVPVITRPILNTFYCLCTYVRITQYKYGSQIRVNLNRVVKCALEPLRAHERTWKWRGRLTWVSASIPSASVVSVNTGCFRPLSSKVERLDILWDHSKMRDKE